MYSVSSEDHEGPVRLLFSRWTHPYFQRTPVLRDSKCLSMVFHYVLGSFSKHIGEVRSGPPMRFEREVSDDERNQGKTIERETTPLCFPLPFKCSDCVWIVLIVFLTSLTDSHFTLGHLLLTCKILVFPSKSEISIYTGRMVYCFTFHLKKTVFNPVSTLPGVTVNSYNFSSTR